MKYKSIFIESLVGTWIDQHKTTTKCVNCKQGIRIPINRGNLLVTCPKCNQIFRYKPQLLFKKLLGAIFLIFVGGISGFSIGYLNHFYDITGFYLFFIIPVGAVILGIISNIGFIAVLTLLRIRGINYSMLILIFMSGTIALLSFWVSQYIVYYTEEITVNYISRIPPPKLKQGQEKVKQMKITLHNLQSSIELLTDELNNIKSGINQIEDNSTLGYKINQQEYKKLISKYNNMVSEHNYKSNKVKSFYYRYENKLHEVNDLIKSYNNGSIGKEITQTKQESLSKKYSFLNYIKKTYEKRSFQIFGLVGKVPIATPSLNIETGSFGLSLLLLKQIGLFFSLPGIWLWAKKYLNI
ncbi:MAG: hypothetical protein Q8O27_00595 [Enterobacteriaceae bacterium]|nr:hypothetical protein [Enterobacteriaceae bacterium]